MTEEIRKVPDDNDDLRVLPIVSRGTASNLEQSIHKRLINQRSSAQCR
jgi:hypothetical protein